MIQDVLHENTQTMLSLYGCGHQKCTLYLHSLVQEQSTGLGPGVHPAKITNTNMKGPPPRWPLICLAKNLSYTDPTTSESLVQFNAGVWPRTSPIPTQQPLKVWFNSMLGFGQEPLLHRPNNLWKFGSIQYWGLAKNLSYTDPTTSESLVQFNAGVWPRTSPIPTQQPLKVWFNSMLGFGQEPLLHRPNNLWKFGSIQYWGLAKNLSYTDPTTSESLAQFNAGVWPRTSPIPTQQPLKVWFNSMLGFGQEPLLYRPNNLWKFGSIQCWGLAKNLSYTDPTTSESLVQFNAGVWPRTSPIPTQQPLKVWFNSMLGFGQEPLLYRPNNLWKFGSIQCWGLAKNLSYTDPTTSESLVQFNAGVWPRTSPIPTQQPLKVWFNSMLGFGQEPLLYRPNNLWKFGSIQCWGLAKNLSYTDPTTSESLVQFNAGVWSRTSPIPTQQPLKVWFNSMLGFGQEPLLYRPNNLWKFGSIQCWGLAKNLSYTDPTTSESLAQFNAGVWPGTIHKHTHIAHTCVQKI